MSWSRAAWPDGAIVHENTLDTYVGRLRRSFATSASRRDLDRARGRLLASVKRLLIRDRVTLASVAVLAIGLAVLGIATNVLLTGS